MIPKYNIINPISNTKKPYYDFKFNYFIFPVDRKYKYFVEAANFNQTKGYMEYFIILDEKPFDENCRKCEVNMYGKCKVKLLGEIKDYVRNECRERGNIEVSYVETINSADVFSIV